MRPFSMTSSAQVCMFTLPRLTSSMALAGQTLCVLLVFFPFLLWGFLSSWEQERTSNAERVLRLSSTLSARQKLLTASTQVLLTTLSLAPVVREGSKEQLLSFLQKIGVTLPDYAGFTVFNADGETLASVLNGKPHEALPSELVRRREYFQRGMEEKRFSVGEAFRLSGNHTVLPMSMPVYGKKDTIERLVVAPLEMVILDDIVRGLLKETHDWIVILDRYKHRVYSYPTSEGNAPLSLLGAFDTVKREKPDAEPLATGKQLQLCGLLDELEETVRTGKYTIMECSSSNAALSAGDEYLFEWTNRDTQYVGSVYELRITQQSEPYMYIAVASEQTMLHDFVFERFWLQLLGMAATVITAIILSRTIGHLYFSDGLERLARVATRTQKGDLSARNGVIPGCREISILASAYDQMLGAQERNSNALKMLSRVDPLTGLWNRRWFFEIALLELSRAVRYGRNLAVIMADLDKFKNINDTYGHTAGDAVLRSFSLFLRDTVREMDVVGRFGGEEFIFVLPETSEVSAHEVMERIRKCTAKLKVFYEGKELHFTASFGVSVFRPEQLATMVSTLQAEPETLSPALSRLHTENTAFDELHEEDEINDAQRHPDDPSEKNAQTIIPLESTALNRLLEILIQRADEALYHSKSEGRNRVSVWNPTYRIIAPSEKKERPAS